MLNACKKVTDVLPFDKKNRWLITNHELFKQLLFAMPFIRSTADLILNSLLYKFQNEVDFIFAFQRALESIASIMEPEVKMELQTFRVGPGPTVNRSRSGEAKSEVISARNEMVKEELSFDEDVPDGVKENLHNIKRLTLIFAKKLYEVYALMRSRNVYTLKDRFDEIMPFSFIKLLVVSTSNFALIVESQQWFESLKHDKNWYKNEIEIAKTDETLKKKFNPVEEANEESPLLDLNSPRISRTASFSSESSASSGSEESKPEMENFGDYDLTSKREMANDTTSEYLEKFMLESDSLNIVDNEVMSKYFVANQCIGILISFVTDPFLYTVSGKWGSKFRKHQDEKLNIFLPCNSEEFEEGGSSKMIQEYNSKRHNAYYFRSQTTAVLLTQIKNHNYILKNNPNFLEFFYQGVCSSLLKPVSRCDVNILIHLITFYMITNPSLSLRQFFASHTLYGLFLDLSCPRVFDFIIKLADPYDSFFLFNEIELDVIWKYLQITDFFGSLITDCSTEKSNSLVEKFDPNYKQSEIQSLIEALPKENKRYRHGSLRYFTRRILEKRDFSTIDLPENHDKPKMDIDQIDDLLLAPVDISKSGNVFAARKSLLRSGTLFARGSLSLKGGAPKEESGLPPIHSRKNSGNAAFLLKSGDQNKDGYSESSTSSKPENKKKPSFNTRGSIKPNSKSTLPYEKASISNLNGAQNPFPNGVFERSRSNSRFKGSVETQRRSSESAIHKFPNFKVIYTNKLPPEQRYKSKIGSLNELKSPVKMHEMPAQSPKSFSFVIQNEEKRQNPSATSKKSELSNGNPKGALLNRKASETLTLINELREQREKYRLYPTDLGAFIDLEVEYKNQIEINKKKGSGKRAQMILELIKFVINGGVEATASQKIRDGIGLPKGKLTKFWSCIFKAKNHGFVDSLLKHYLFNIHVNARANSNLRSGFIAGEIVNMILKNRTKNKEIILYKTIIMQACIENMPMLHFVFHLIFEFLSDREANQKRQLEMPSSLLQTRSSSRIDLKPSSKANLTEVSEASPFKAQGSRGSSLSLGSLRLLLAETIVLIVQNESKGFNPALQSFPDTTLDIFINWLTCYLPNDMFHLLFYKLTEAIMTSDNQILMVSLLFKMNLISILHKSVFSMKRNGMFVGDSKLRLFYQSAGRIVKVIHSTLKTNKSMENVRSQLACSICFRSLEEEFIKKPPRVKTNPSDVSLYKNQDYRRQSSLEASHEEMRPKGQKNSIVPVSMVSLENEGRIVNALERRINENTRRQTERLLPSINFDSEKSEESSKSISIQGSLEIQGEEKNSLAGSQNELEKNLLLPSHAKAKKGGKFGKK